MGIRRGGGGAERMDMLEETCGGAVFFNFLNKWAEGFEQNA